MSIAQFSLVKKISVVFTRQTAGSYVNGVWTEGTNSQVTINANIHPFSDYQMMLLPESERSKSWLWVFTADEVRQEKEGTSGHGADRFTWNGEVYEIIKTQRYQMGISDHYESKATRIELTPN